MRSMNHISLLIFITRRKSALCITTICRFCQRKSCQNEQDVIKSGHSERLNNAIEKNFVQLSSTPMTKVRMFYMKENRQNSNEKYG